VSGNASVETGGSVTAQVPAQLSLVLGAPATFVPFTAGIARDYLAETTATVTSIGADAALRVADTGAVAPGHLVNGSYVLQQALQASANGGGYSPVSGIPATLLTSTGPASAAQVTIGLRQPIAVSDPLRTGNYAKTLTFSLSTTAP